MSDLSRQILIVEDEGAQQHMYRRAITRLGYGIDCAGSVGTAEKMILENEYAIAILDLNLGGQSGMTVFEHIRDHSPSTSVIVATGFGTLAAAQQAIRLEAVDFLTKPISLDALEASLDRAWKRYELVQSPIDSLKPHSEAKTADQNEPLSLRTSLNIEDAERDLICEALRRAKDNRKVAAQMLGISERKLYYRLSQFELR